jgi:transcriptional regulator with XRE-family HTH domain
MLAQQLGTMILAQRKAKRILQSDLARRAKVSRTVLSRLEQGHGRAVQTDVLERLLAALECPATITPGEHVNDRNERIAARLRNQALLERRRSRHYRLAARLATDRAKAPELIRQAQAQVANWRSHQTCSEHYVRRWTALLRLAPPALARKMTELGDWEDALFQNSPWVGV